MAQATRADQDAVTIEDNRVSPDVPPSARPLACIMLPRLPDGRKCGCHTARARKAVIHHQGLLLMADCGVRKVDLESMRRRVRWCQGRCRFAFCHCDSLEHFKRHDRCRWLTYPALHEATYERHCRAVKDWHFGPINLDQGVVNAAARQRRHQMFNCRNSVTRGVHKPGAKACGSPRSQRAGIKRVTVREISTLENQIP